MPKSTAYRVLGMLVRVGAVEHEGTGYRIALQMMAIVQRRPKERSAVALPYVLDLHRARAHRPSVCPCAAGGQHHRQDMQVPRNVHHRPPVFGAPQQVWEDGRQPSVAGPGTRSGERRAGTGSCPVGGRAERCGTCRSTRSTSPRSCSPRAASSTPCWHRTGSPPPSCSASR
ncbi:hypothetical protein ACIGPN_28990 [Streptomyces afghaniensis]|uniref:hypothetical protein n=1 Tax=Streptomyces afghaniensis TaxID=66865 RepID=UPI0037D365ED